MKKKLTIVLALLILFILVILAFIGFFYYQTIDTNHKNITRLAQNRLEYASQRLLMGQRSIEDNAGTLLVDSDVRELRTDEKPTDDYSYLLQLNRISAKLKERLINSSDECLLFAVCVRCHKKTFSFQPNPVPTSKTR